MRCRLVSPTHREPKSQANAYERRLARLVLHWLIGHICWILLLAIGFDDRKIQPWAGEWLAGLVLGVLAIGAMYSFVRAIAAGGLELWRWSCLSWRWRGLSLLPAMTFLVEIAWLAHTASLRRWLPVPNDDSPRARG